jgi:predicted ABC-type ATPase
MNQMSSRLWDSLTTFWPISLLDSGLADALCLETYEHGTSPSSYNSIMRYGVDPHFGGLGGETGLQKASNGKLLAFAEARTVNRFFVFDHQPRYGPICPHIIGNIIKNVWVRQFAITASIAQETSILRNIAGCFLGFAVPIIKLRFRSDDPTKSFENDEFFEPGFASYTEDKIAVDHIGIRGTLQQGLNKDLLNRVKKQPAQCIWGVVKMVTAVALIAFAIVASIYSTIALYILLAYLSIKTAHAFAQFIVPLLSHFPAAPPPQRDDVEGKIINAFTEHVEVSTGQPTAILFSGCSGSGKTTVRQRLIAGKERQYVQLDSDQIMERMPEYQRLLQQGVKDAASIVHIDSLRLRTKMMKRAIKEKKSFILEGTGTNFFLYKDIIRKLRSQNYRIKLIRCEVDLEEARRRVHRRAQRTGRHVPDEAIEFSYTQSARHLSQLKTLVDDFEIGSSDH